MKLNKKRIVIFSVIIVIFILLLPILYKDRTYTPLVGPSLSEIEYTEISFNNGNLKLAGMMILPEGEGPFPVIVHFSTDPLFEQHFHRWPDSRRIWVAGICFAQTSSTNRGTLRWWQCTDDDFVSRSHQYDFRKFGTLSNNI
jgi:hypothetical protein